MDYETMEIMIELAQVDYERINDLLIVNGNSEILLKEYAYRLGIKEGLERMYNMMLEQMEVSRL